MSCSSGCRAVGENLITRASFRGHASARDAQAAAEFAGCLSGPAPEGADEMAGVGIAKLHGDPGDLHLALLQKRSSMSGEDAVHHRFEGGVVDAEMALQGPAGQFHFPGHPANARPAFEQGQPDEVLDAFHDVARVGHGRRHFNDAGIIRPSRTEGGQFQQLGGKDDRRHVAARKFAGQHVLHGRSAHDRRSDDLYPWRRPSRSGEAPQQIEHVAERQDIVLLTPHLRRSGNVVGPPRPRPIDIKAKAR
jgi:hypothetical protein